MPPSPARVYNGGVTRKTHPPHLRLLAAGSWVHLGLLWLAGAALRVTILEVPPVLPSIHRDLHLDEKLVGALTGLPVLLLAAAAVPGSLLIARLGARRALVVGLGLVAAAGAVRGVGPSTPLLLAMTVVMGLGIAVSQPSLPALAKQWWPDRVGLATAAYSNGLLIGEIAAAALTVPLVLPLVGGSWQLSFLIWSLPVALAAIGILLLSSHAQRDPGAPVMRWWPDWHSARTWRLGLILGCASTAYFGTNAFIPDYLKAIHHPELIAAALTSLNLIQLPASILVGAAPDRLVGRRWPLVAAGVLLLTAVAGFLGTSESLVVAAAGVVGFCSALVLILNLALPPLLTDADDIHRLSAAMFTISYACASVSAIVGGAVWDATGIPATAFTLVAAAGLLMVVLALGLDLRRTAPISTYSRQPTAGA
jgi:MFS transporter, CP family, cyanate transporter